MGVQWFFDQGAWDMAATNKVFVYVFNTEAEDLKVARVLSSRDSEKEEGLLAPDVSESITQAYIRAVTSASFTVPFGLETVKYSVNPNVIDALMIDLIHLYPSLKKLDEERSSNSAHRIAKPNKNNTGTQDTLRFSLTLNEPLIKINQNYDTRLANMEAKVYDKL
ncbi:Hypothetical protein PHPALM_8786 [Phytophthora palmivora]|uniref:Uncharacterized protein n=1 Tax=Phytophthora palmivora TaxID=4796 RepID=A0A2P4Y8Z1_9STRA|nr:Hypothetical protein PHPALM_8786 [Phytophthora palmivora]